MIWLIALLATAQAEPLTPDITTALTPRHTGANCDAIHALGPLSSVVPALVETAETVAMPPWVGTRAAHCVSELISVDTLAHDAAIRWVSDDTRAGYGLIILDNLDSLPTDQALPLARLAQQHASSSQSFGRYALPKLERSLHPAVQALSVAP
ncbi:MAG: hypothetical protein ACJATT_002449 [Myxococcota bacterium]|jgi:hypothetical protein